MFAQLRLSDISIHVPREGDDLMRAINTTSAGISIHVPREGDDQIRILIRVMTIISIHVPREGDDRRPDQDSSGTSNFNPRPP